MTDYQRLREFPVQLFKEFSQRDFLLRRSGVSIFPKRVQSALVADTDGMPVMPNHVSPDHFQWPSQLYRAVPSDDIVIPDTVLKPSVMVPVVDFLGTALLPRANSRAMNND